jgi:hypothetical protein
MYGLETIQLAQNEMNKLDSFQIKCIRRILKTPPTFTDRTQTKQIVRGHAKSYNVDVTKISFVWKKQKLKLFGHILRRDHADPLRQVLFGSRTFARRILPSKRVGSKLDWLNETAKMLYTPSVEWHRRAPTKLT